MVHLVHKLKLLEHRPRIGYKLSRRNAEMLRTREKSTTLFESAAALPMVSICQRHHSCASTT